MTRGIILGGLLLLALPLVGGSRLGDRRGRVLLHSAPQNATSGKPASAAAAQTNATAGKALQAATNATAAKGLASNATVQKAAVVARALRAASSKAQVVGLLSSKAVQAHGRRHKKLLIELNASRAAAPQASNEAKATRVTVMAPTGLPVGPWAVSLAAKPNSCKCRYIGLCTCRAAAAFMECIAEACSSGDCDCEASHFQKACQAMSEACPSVGLMCMKDKAQCLDIPSFTMDSNSAILHDLEEMRLKKCKLEKAVESGFVNAKSRLRIVESDIQAHLDELRHRGVKAHRLPSMDCDDDDVSAGAEEEEEKGDGEDAAVVAVADDNSAAVAVADDNSAASAAKPGWLDAIGGVTSYLVAVLSGAAAYLVFLLVVAFIYNRFRMGITYPQPTTTAGMSEFAYSLFGCVQDLKITCLACCCPVLRWSDTMDKANDQKEFLSYWQGIGLAALVYTAYVGFAVLRMEIAMGVFSLVIAGIGVYFRQKLRRKFEITAGTVASYAEDCLAWYFCSCCAIIQEARQVESVKVNY